MICLFSWVKDSHDTEERMADRLCVIEGVLGRDSFFAVRVLNTRSNA